MIPESTFVWFRVAILLIGLSIMYKRTAFFVGLENMMVGSACGIVVAQQWRALSASIGESLAAGDLFVIVPLLFGLSYFSIFSRRPAARYLLRLVVVVELALQLGLSAPTQYFRIYEVALGFTNWTNITTALMGILFICAVMYFIFGRRLSGPLRIPRTIGVYGIYIFCGIMTSSVVYLGIDNFIGISYDMVRHPSVVLVLVPMAWMIWDQWRQGWPAVKRLTQRA